MLNWLLLIIGVVLLIKGADFFVGGSSNIAKKLKIPPLIIGLTLVSMGTGAPEAAVSMTASINGLNDMCISNVVGSSVFNVFLVLGIGSIIYPLVFKDIIKKYDIPVMVTTYAILLIFGFVTSPYVITLLEGIIFMVFFILYTICLVFRAKKEPVEQEKKEEKKQHIALSILLVILGLAMIIFGGNIVVDNASIIALSLGMSEALVGLTIVAIGTSLPELVTSIVAISKKENDISVGNVIGSNIFNIAFIVGLSASMSPILLNPQVLVDVIVMLLSGLLILAIALLSKDIKRWHGIVFVLLYIAYITFIILRNYLM